MKNIQLISMIALAMLPFLNVKAQVPQAINYQVVLRNAQDEPIDDPSVCIQFRILKSSASGQEAFREAHTDVAATNGLVNLQIGTMNPVGFDTLHWAEGPLFLEVGVDLDNGSNFTVMGVQQLVSVPYALFAKGSEDWERNGENVYHIDGNVGIGVKPEDSFSKFSLKKTSNDNVYIAFFEKEGAGSAYIGFKSGPDVNPNPKRTYFGFSDAEFSINALNPGVHQTSLKLDATTNIGYFQGGRFGINTGDPQSTLDVNGTTRTKILEVTGADIIEKANSIQLLQPGEVIVLDSSLPNHVKRCRKAYDRLSVGVVSGAGGITHGMALSQEGLLDGNVSFAIAGRVMVKVTGNVKPGDLLTTSTVPGHAMAAKSRRKRDGAVIGKALTFPDGEGLVLMLVIWR